MISIDKQGVSSEEDFPLGSDVPYTKQDALADLFMSEEKLDVILRQLRRKKNIILEGAPGVGKTFVAKRLAQLIQQNKREDTIESIQFHQSYSYEDFIQGLRPKTDGGFSIKNGIFYNFAKLAQLAPNTCTFSLSMRSIGATEDIRRAHDAYRSRQTGLRSPARSPIPVKTLLLSTFQKSHLI